MLWADLGDGLWLLDHCGRAITRGKDTAIYKHGDLEQVGINDFGNGYPDYDSVRLSSFVLTNSGVGNESESFAVSVFKNFENGLDMRVGYG